MIKYDSETIDDWHRIKAIEWANRMWFSSSSPFPEKGKKNKKVLFSSSHLLCSVLSPFIRLNARRHWVNVRLSAVIFLSNVFSPDLPFYFHGFSLDIAMNSINCGLRFGTRKESEGKVFVRHWQTLTLSTPLCVGWAIKRRKMRRETLKSCL